MTAEAEQLDDLFLFIYPDEEVITLDVTLHATGVIAGEHVRSHLLWNRFFVLKHTNHLKQFLYQAGPVPVSFEILFELGAESYSFHPSMDLMNDSKLLVFIVPEYSPCRASSMAAIVSAFGR